MVLSQGSLSTILVDAMKLSLLALAPLAAAGGGARGAISETLTDKLRDQGLPVAIDFLNAFKVPDQGWSWGIWSYGVNDARRRRRACLSRVR